MTGGAPEFHEPQTTISCGKNVTKFRGPSPR
jgi:hypothetical protein